MKHSEQIEQLAAALSVAQGQMAGAPKSSANPFYKSKYADLQSVWEACRLPLSNNGLAIIQSPEIRHDAVNPDVNALRSAIDERAMPPEVVVTTTLMHLSGQWVETELSMWPKDNTPQAIGSCISYARRYALAAMVGVYQADDDAESAQGRGRASDEDSGAGQEILNEYLADLVNAIKNNDVTLARSRWNELNVMGTTPEVWRLLSTKQKKSLREILQITQAMATPEGAKESATPESAPEGQANG